MLQESREAKRKSSEFKRLA